MYKVVIAVNSMVENSSLISHVISKEHGELFFLYDERFKWSIYTAASDSYTLTYYPGNQPLEELAEIDKRYFKEYVTYSTEEIKTKEAVESFADLYRTVQNKVYMIDDVLDQIINTAA